VKSGRRPRVSKTPGGPATQQPTSASPSPSIPPDKASVVAPSSLSACEQPPQRLEACNLCLPPRRGRFRTTKDPATWPLMALIQGHVAGPLWSFHVLQRSSCCRRIHRSRSCSCCRRSRRSHSAVAKYSNCLPALRSALRLAHLHAQRVIIRRSRPPSTKSVQRRHHEPDEDHLCTTLRSGTGL
jgi:hypothetical protein